VSRSPWKSPCYRNSVAHPGAARRRSPDPLPPARLSTPHQHPHHNLEMSLYCRAARSAGDRATGQKVAAVEITGAPGTESSIGRAPTIPETMAMKSSRASKCFIGSTSLRASSKYSATFLLGS